MNQPLNHIDDPRARSRRHRYPHVFDVPNEEHIGSRGGRKIPIDVIWKQHGTGFFTKLFDTCGCAALFPHVRYHNGDNKPRTMRVAEWVKFTGKGAFRWPADEELSTHDKGVLKPCDAEKSRYSGRTFEIVKSIVDNGGTLTIRSER